MLSTLAGMGAYLLAPKLLAKLRDLNIQIVHAVPGRLRLQNQKWKQPQIAAYLEKNLVLHPLISTCRVSPITGSMLLYFSTPYLQQQQLDELFECITHTTVKAISQTDDQLMIAMRKKVNGVNATMKKATGGYTSVDSLLIVFLLFQGMTRFKVNPAFSSSLLYWAYTLLKNEKHEGGEGHNHLNHSSHTWTDTSEISGSSSTSDTL
ncbi:HMA2 domain-containing protein [Metabacillus iocasae]|uniref:Uncharacterized protein n=1 Tax=Priestia iocasae TaxID=2291674 RepID=A0ABS2R075_9BACI|nr:hypothetical protein [Metabacillus iocasae]MBM7705062.1 hypothetical protein [Metabacillus iocasae]